MQFLSLWGYPKPQSIDVELVVAGDYPIEDGIHIGDTVEVLASVSPDLASQEVTIISLTENLIKVGDAFRCEALGSAQIKVTSVADPTVSETVTFAIINPNASATYLTELTWDDNWDGVTPSTDNLEFINPNTDFFLGINPTGLVKDQVAILNFEHTGSLVIPNPTAEITLVNGRQSYACSTNGMTGTGTVTFVLTDKLTGDEVVRSETVTVNGTVVTAANLTLDTVEDWVYTDVEIPVALTYAPANLPKLDPVWDVTISGAPANSVTVVNGTGPLNKIIRLTPAAAGGTVNISATLGGSEVSQAVPIKARVNGVTLEITSDDFTGTKATLGDYFTVKAIVDPASAPQETTVTLNPSSHYVAEGAGYRLTTVGEVVIAGFSNEANDKTDSITLTVGYAPAASVNFEVVGTGVTTDMIPSGTSFTVTTNVLPANAKQDTTVSVTGAVTADGANKWKATTGDIVITVTPVGASTPTTTRTYRTHPVPTAVTLNLTSTDFLNGNELYIGQQFTTGTSVTPAGAVQTVNVTLSPSDIATKSGNTYTIVKAGTLTVTATHADVSSVKTTKTVKALVDPRPASVELILSGTAVTNGFIPGNRFTVATSALPPTANQTVNVTVSPADMFRLVDGEYVLLKAGNLNIEATSAESPTIKDVLTKVVNEMEVDTSISASVLSNGQVVSSVETNSDLVLRLEASTSRENLDVVVDWVSTGDVFVTGTEAIVKLLPGVALDLPIQVEGVGSFQLSAKLQYVGTTLYESPFIEVTSPAEPQT